MAIGGYVNTQSGWYDYGQVLTLTAIPDEGWQFKEWSGDVPVEKKYDNPLEITVTGDISITPIFIKQTFTITVQVNGSGSVIPGTTIVEYGSDKLFQFIANSNYHVDNVLVDGLSLGAPNNYTFQDIDSNHTLTVNFEINDIRLRVLSSWGSPTPTVGSHVYEAGDLVSCSIPTDSIVDPLNASIRYVRDGWTGTGDVPSSGTGNSFDFNIYQYSELTWKWKTQYYLSAQTSGDGEVNEVSGWYDSGEEVIIEPTPDTNATFFNWTGDVPPTHENDDPLTVTMDQPRNIVANFQPMYFPQGGIVLWSGAIIDIPTGWSLCDGNNGTPNLQDRFVVGAGNSYNPGNTGGTNFHQLSIAEMPAHNHGGTETGGAHTHSGSTNSVTVSISGSFSGSTNSDGNHRHSFVEEGGHIDTGLQWDAGGGAIRWWHEDTIGRNTDYAGSHSHSFSGSFSGSDSHSHTVSIASGGSHSHSIYSQGGSSSHENRPPYYALAYIMKL